MIRRDFYLKELARKMWNGEVKVITGVRKYGKSVLLFGLLFYQSLLDHGVRQEQIIQFIQFELDQHRCYKFRNPITLCEYVKSVVNPTPLSEGMRAALQSVSQ